MCHEISLLPDNEEDDVKNVGEKQAQEQELEPMFVHKVTN